MAFCLLLVFSGCNGKSETESDIESKKLEYAMLLISEGVNLQKGMKLLIESEVENFEFVHMCEKAAYDMGAADVIIMWDDSINDKLKYQFADDSAFSEYSPIKDAAFQKAADEEMAFLRLHSVYPGLLDDVDPDLIKRGNVEYGEGYKAFKVIKNSYVISWCVGNVANEYWARALFPDLSSEDALEKLWNIIFDSCYVTGDGNALENWQKHVDDLLKYKEKLNSLNIKSFHYKNSLGTDFTVEFNKDAQWAVSASKTVGGLGYSANIPSEEVFTAPLAESVNGTIVASMPLEKNGTIIKDIKFTVKDGKITESYASEGLELLNDILDTDDGARYFGELSLVPVSSPIAKQNIILYSTLFDENASCHMAFGSSYSECIKGGTSMSESELKESGLNLSSVHVDIMIGTEDLSITAETYDGKNITIFENGNFSEDILG